MAENNERPLKNLFAGQLICLENDGDQNNFAKVAVELTEVLADGTVELAFDDRNERCYLKFSLTELVAASLTHVEG